MIQYAYHYSISMHTIMGQSHQSTGFRLLPEQIVSEALYNQLYESLAQSMRARLALPDHASSIYLDQLSLIGTIEVPD